MSWFTNYTFGAWTTIINVLAHMWDTQNSFGTYVAFHSHVDHIITSAVNDMIIFTRWGVTIENSRGTCLNILTEIIQVCSALSLSNTSPHSLPIFLRGGGEGLDSLLIRTTCMPSARFGFTTSICQYMGEWIRIYPYFLLFSFPSRPWGWRQDGESKGDLEWL